MASQNRTTLRILAILLCSSAVAAHAAIPNQSESFSDGTFADDAALFTAGYTFSGSGGLDATQTFGDADGGDGVNDGGIFVDGASIGGMVEYTFAGTIEDGVQYRFGAQMFKSGTSFVDAEVELLAGGSVVTSLPFEARVNGSGPATDPMGPASSASGLFPATLYYQGDGSTAGQALSFRVKQTRGFNDSFDVGIDNWDLQTVDLSAPIADQNEVFTGYASIGYEWSTQAGYIEVGNDPLTDPVDGIPGDPALDGAIFVEGNNGGPPRSVVEHRFDGSLEDGQAYKFSTYLFQSSVSFGLTTIDLISDPGGPSEMVVASSDTDLVVNGKVNDTEGPLFNLYDVEYTADATTAGKGLAFRISSDRDAGGGSSDVAIDGWSLTLVEGGLDGDYNFDGMVDAADYTVWRDTLGSTVALNADGDGSGEIDAGDYTVWESNYGASASTSTVSVPEPASLLVVAGALFCLPRRRDGC